MCAHEGLQNFVKNVESVVELSSRCMDIILLKIVIIHMFILFKSFSRLGIFAFIENKFERFY